MSQPLKLIIEALLMSSHQALSVDKLYSSFNEEEAPDRTEIRQALEQLQLDYQDRAIELKHIATGFRFQTKQEYALFINHLWQEKPARYSRAFLETLAIIAYRQPVTRGEIEEIRGVAVSSNIMRNLLERGWVKIVGHRDVPGKPGIYATCKDFMDYFNLKSLDELPSLILVKSLEEIEQMKPEIEITEEESKIPSDDLIEEDVCYE